MMSLEELHDSPINKLFFSLEEKKIIINIISCDDDICSYYDLIFSGVESIDMKEFYISDFSDMDIYSCEIASENKKEVVTFIIKLGFGKPTTQLKIVYSSLKINKMGTAY